MISPVDNDQPASRRKSRTSSATIRRLVVAGQFAAMVIDEINGPLEAFHNLNYRIARTPDQRMISRKRINLRKRLKADVNALGPSRLQVFSSLIGNAVDALKKETLCVRVGSCANEAHLTVADNGRDPAQDLRSVLHHQKGAWHWPWSLSPNASSRNITVAFRSRTTATRPSAMASHSISRFPFSPRPPFILKSAAMCYIEQYFAGSAAYSSTCR